MTTNKKTIEKVKETLMNYDEIEPDDPQLIDMKQKSVKEAILNILMTDDIQKIVEPNEDILQRYEEALITSGNKSKSIIFRRYPNERYQNDYNPEWMFAWYGNMDIQITLEIFEIVTYITEYYSKDESGIIEYLKMSQEGHGRHEYAEKVLRNGKRISISSSYRRTSLTV